MPKRIKGPPGFGGFGGPGGGGQWIKNPRTDWKKTQRIVLSMTPEHRVAIAIAMKQEAQYLRRKIIENMTAQGAKAGKPFSPLSPNTIVSRRFKRRPVGKILIDTADLRNSIQAIVQGDDAFVGVLRTARGRDGRPLANIARVHEFGQTIAIPVTRAMVRFLMAMFNQGDAERQSGRPGSGSLRVGGVLIVKVPPRPFIMPVVEKHYLGAARGEAGRRFLARVGRLMRGDMGTIPGQGTV